MRKLLTFLLPIYLVVLSAFISYGQKVPSNSERAEQYASKYNSELMNSYGLNMPIDFSESLVNTNETSSKLTTDAFVQSKLTPSINTWNKSAKGFSQDTATVLYSEDFDPGTWSATPKGWKIFGDASTNWRVFNGNEAGGTRPECYFYHDPVFSGYTKMAIDTTLNTTGYTNLALSLKTLLLYKNDGFTLRIETTSDGGTTWNTAWEKSGNSNFGPDSLLIIINTVDVGSENFQFALSFEGSTTNLERAVFDDILLTSGPDIVCDVDFNVVDEEGNFVEDARISLDGYGALLTDENGHAVFDNLLPGTYLYGITAKDLDLIQDTVILTDSDVTIDTTMVEPIYIYYEDFTKQPNGWTKLVHYPDYIKWLEGTMEFSSDGIGDIIYVTPEIELYKDSTVTVEVGESTSSGVKIGVGLLSDPNDTSTFVMLDSFKVEAGYRFFTVTLPDTLTNTKHIGFKFIGSVGKRFSLSTMYIKPKDKYTPHRATFIVKDADGNFIENANVSIVANGVQTTDSLGQAIFKSVFAGTHSWSAYAGLDYGSESGAMTIVDNDTIINIILKDPAYIFYEDFEAGQPDNWAYFDDGTDQCQWQYGEVFLYKKMDPSAGPLMVRCPEVNLSQVKSVTVKVGGCVTGDGEILFGTLSERDDPSTFTELAGFTVSNNYKYFTVNISEYAGTDTYFAFKHEGGAYSYYYIDMVFMEAKESVAKYPVTFNVKDDTGELCEGAEVNIAGYGPVLTDNSGQAIIDMYSTAYHTVRIKGDKWFEKQQYFIAETSPTTVNATLKTRGEYFFIEEFNGGIPFSWTKYVTSGDGLQYWNNEVNYYNYLNSDDPLMLVSSEINLSKVDAITVEIGKGRITNPSLIIGYLTDPKDPATFHELGTAAAVEDFKFYTIDVSDIDIEGSYLGFKNGDGYPSYFILRTIYLEGHGATEYCMDSTLSKDGYISRVKFDDINNTSDWQPEVGDYTEIVTRIEPGKSDFITVSNGNPNATDRITVWADWNQDYQFDMDTDEEFILTNDGTGTTFTGEITVPVGTEYGYCRMRIRLDSDAIPTPCGELNSGETEDYLIRVTNERHPAVGIVFEDNFDSYVVDDYVAYQNPDEWNTSNNNPGGGKDVLVSDDQAYSGANSANVLAGDNIIKELDIYFDLGVHTVSSKVFVPSGGDAYYAILSAYEPVAEQAFEVSYNADGTGSVNAGAANAATFAYTLNTWMESKVVIDLDYDSAEFFIDGVSIVKWQWSAGATGTGIARQLGALNFAGTTDASNYYIDDVMIETSEICPPSGFRAELFDGNNVRMNWVAPRGEEYMRWDNGKHQTNLSYSGKPFYAACRWTTDQLEPYDGNYITSISIFVNAQADFVLKAWLGANSDVLILSQKVNSDAIVVGKFNDFKLETPIEISLLNDIWIGYLCSNYDGNTSPVGMDKGPVNSGYGDLWSPDGLEWTILSSGSWNSNWNLAAKVSATADGKSLAKPLERKLAESTTTLNSAQSANFTMPQFTDVVTGKSELALNKIKADEALIGYNVYRNGELIADSLSNTNYTDTDIAGGKYAYEVKALYNEGLSSKATPGAIEMSVGDLIPREFVILEIVTGTWCVNCPAAARGAEELAANGHNVGIIEYHTGDDYETSESRARADYYGTTGWPTAYFDGVIEYPGGSYSGNLYTTYLDRYNERMAVKTSFEMESNYYNTNDNNYIVDIDAKSIGVYPDQENLKVFAVLTESHIEEIWQGMEVLDFVCRDMIPTANGSKADFTNDSIQSYQLEFTISDDYEFDNVELVVFLQDMNSKEILVSTMAELGVPPLAIPANLTGPASAIINTDIALTWDAVDAGSHTLTGYNVYRKVGDGEFTLLANTTETSYTDNILESGVANYYVTAVYNEGESDASNTLAVDITTSIEESIFNNTVLYPNPATNNVNITSDYSIQSVRLYNFAGLEIMNETVKGSTYQVNTSELVPGIYLFQIEFNEGRIAKRIVIE